jgi:uncharacterized membrane protein HdeD (DUF308 family)
MTDPRSNPAGSPGNEGGVNPPEAGGTGTGSTGTGSTGRHGLFRRGSSGSNQSGSTQPGSVGTTTRTSTPSNTVPQQTGQQASGQTRPAQSYGRTEYSETTYTESSYGQAAYGEPAEAQNVLAKAAKMSWTVVLLGSLVMIGLGIALLVWPHASLTVVAILFGAALVISGAIRLYEGFTAHGGESGGMRAAYIVLGLIAVVAGVYCLRHHDLSLFLVAFVVGVYFIMYGIADIGAAASSPGGGRGLRFVTGIFAIAAGLVLVIWPGISLVLMLTIMAAWLLLYGLMLGFLAFSLRRAAKAVTGGRTRTTATPARAA